VAGVTKTIPAGSLRHIDQNIETAYAHFYGLSFQHEVGPALVVKVEYAGSKGRRLYDLATGTSAAPPWSTRASAPPVSGRTRSTRFNSRGNG